MVAEVEKDAPWLLTIEYYVEEIRALIAHFKLAEYYVFGSSWGTVVAQEWAVTVPLGLKGLMLDGRYEYLYVIF
jgi:proline iminopeptidase